MLNLGLSLSADSVIQKTKWHFNHMSSSQMKSGLEKIQQELELQPPAVLSLEGTDVANGMLNGHTPVHSEPGKCLLLSGEGEGMGVQLDFSSH